MPGDGFPGDDWAGDDWVDQADQADRLRDDPDWDYADFDPYTSPPDGEEAWLSDLPLELRDEFLVDPWSGAGESTAAGFLHRAAGRAGVGFAAGGVADLLEPGPVLAGLVADAASDSGSGACPASLDAATSALGVLGESELVGVLCASRRLASWAAAQETAAVITLARRRAAQARDRQAPSLIEHLDDEVATALTLTGRAGGRLLEIAGGLARLKATWAALAAGVIDWPRAVVIADELAALDELDALAVERSVLPRAGELTTGQLRAALRRAVLAVDPAAAGRRRRAARKDAGVHVWDEPSGNSALAGRELPPAEVIAADQRITALARWLQDHGADGTLQQLRAAVFTALLAGRSITTLLPPGSAADRPQRPGPGAAGPGPDPGPASQPESSGGGSAEPGLSGAESAGAGGGPPDNQGWPAVTGTVNLTMPLTAWLGMTDAPGEVGGFGPADAGTCRDLAAWLAARPPGKRPSARWCLTLTDRAGHAVAHARARHGPGPDPPDLAAGWVASLRPVFLETGGCTHRREAAGYQPPASLRSLVTARQRTCAAPGCRRPASACDLDHTIPHHKGGRTCECNLAPLCRRHHRAKQAAGWHLEQAEPGLLAWTLPHGRTYQTRPGPYPV